VICSIRFFLSSILLFAASCLVAAPPVPFSGKLAVDGTNFHGNALFSFSIVDGEGAVHWKHANEPDARIENFVMNGRYLVLLGGQGMQTLPADLFLKHDSLFLRVSVDLKDGKGLRLLEPDQRITSSPYALSAEIARLAEKASLADGVTPGAITAGMIDTGLLADLNRTAGITEITREMLPQDVRDDLNRTVRLQDLSPEVSQSINRSISLNDLDSQVITELNNSIAPGSISLDQLSQQVRNDINATITRERLSSDVLADLNRTVRLQDLSPEVSQSINRSITLNDLDSQVITELNNSIATGSITLDLLSSQVRNDLNRTITKSMLSQEVLNELNSSSGGGGGVVPGSLLAVPKNQSAPSGYELYQRGEPKVLAWQEMASLSMGRLSYAGLEVLNGKIYFIGGQVANDAGIKVATNLVERYDPLTNSWDTIAPLSVARSGCVTAVVNNKIYCIGGVGLSSVEIYDPQTESWSAGTTLPWNRGEGNAISVDNKIYLIGGREESNKVLCFDTTINAWSELASFPGGGLGWQLLLIEGKIWALGGWGTGLMYSYNIESDFWRLEGTMPLAKNGQVAWFAHGKIYFGGGRSTDHSTYFNRLEKYDPITQTWIDSEVIPANLYYADSVTLNDKIYIVGGNNNSGLLNKVFAADLNASVSGVFDLYRKDGNASSGVPTVQAEVADGTITKSMLSQEVLNELNSSSGDGGVVPGSLLAVPANQSAPSGYSLYQSGEPKDLVWEEKAPVSVARYAFDGVEVLGGKIYFVGGQDGSGAKNIAERYDQATNTWATLANMSATREGVACAVLNGKLYAISGRGLSSVEVFDPSSGNWTAGTALPSELRHGTAITVDGKIYLIGGVNSSDQNINQVLCFDPSTSQWSTKANMPTARHGAKLVWFENRIWAIGGNNGTDTNKVESYDPATDTWQAEASLTTGRHWPVAWVANGGIYVGGGYDGSSYLNSIEVYDPATKQWASAGNFPENKFVADAVVLNNKAYVVAGVTAAGVYSNKVFAADLNASLSGVFDLYRKDGNASSGVPVAEVADESIGISKLDATILKYLKPEITNQPQAQTVFADTNHTISVFAEGKYLTYQWKKNGTTLAGETNATLTITDANSTQHDGNYTVVVSNDFGSVESGEVEVKVSDSLLNGLVGWWKFDEGSGTVAYDSSGNGNDGTLTNGPTWATGKIGGALSFDGVDDYVGVATIQNVNGGGVTFSAWIKPTHFDSINYPHIISGAGVSFHGAGPAYISSNNKGRVGFYLGGSSAGNVFTRVVPLLVWSHITAISNGTNYQIFWNGALEQQSSQTTGQVGDSAIMIGNKTGGSDRTWLGLIDDVRIYNRALSTAEVQGLHQLGQ